MFFLPSWYWNVTDVGGDDPFFKLPKLMSEVLLIVSYLDTEDLAEDFWHKRFFKWFKLFQM